MRQLVLLAATIALGSALAEEAIAQNHQIILYDHPGFTGEQRPLTTPVSNLGHVNFNDRADSLVVVSGLWQVCTNVNYRGSCQTLGVGSYSDLSGLGLTNALSSVQPVEASSTRPEATIYADVNFGGRSQRLVDSTTNLGHYGLNDTVSSVQVRGGAWQICSDINYRGSCRTLQPGSYSNLAHLGLQDSISSMQLLTETATVTGITLYQNPNFEGRSLALSEANYNIGAQGFNDQAVSAIVSAGTWEVCENVGFGGRCQRLSPGVYGNLGELGLARTISSVRPVNF